MLQCDKENMGCNGGIIRTALKHLEDVGTARKDCLPYASENGTVPECINECTTDLA